jgi:hypothetical protein
MNDLLMGFMTVDEAKVAPRWKRKNAEERGDATVVLQPGLIDVEVHPVDAFDFQSHVLLEDFGDRT